MNPKNKIKWDMILDAYNKASKTDYKTTKDMLQALYIETKSMHRMDYILGVSYTCINKKMKDEGIKIGPCGKGPEPKCLKELQKLPKEFIEKNDVPTIAKTIGYNRFYTRQVLRANGFQYVGRRRSKYDS